MSMECFHCCVAPDPCVVMVHSRGGTESTRHAVQLINSLIQDPAKELEDLIPRNHIRAPGSKTTSAPFPTPTGANLNLTIGAKALGSLVTSSGVSFQSSSSQTGGKMGKGLSGVRQPFPVSLPLAYAHPQLALLAAQTMHQIRLPRLPMAQFGGTFSPAASTWGPFPVRPLSPGSANSSPKHNGGSSGNNQTRSNLSSHNDHNNTSSTGSSVSSPSASNSQTATTTGSPHTPNHPHGAQAQPSAPTPSSVRKQLFTSDPKHTGINSVSMVTATTVSSSHSVRGTVSPAHQHTGLMATYAPNTPHPQVAPISQPPKSPPSAPTAPPGKEKLTPSLSQEGQHVSVNNVVSSGGFTAPAMAAPSKPEPRQQQHQPPPPLTSTSSSDPPPPLQSSSHLPPSSSAPSHKHPTALYPTSRLPLPASHTACSPRQGPTTNTPTSSSNNNNRSYPQHTATT
ncbi:unnamed protein product [Oncorhynchus mykiss]|uniref:Uncharacterized protein n=1 Tax=Oncorhynchus mykiss TaxID=8022 RepID=A0A061AG31_ONCMY|nr:unnamed protein product [Oncorhynchus mykiss]